MVTMVVAGAAMGAFLAVGTWAVLSGLDPRWDRTTRLLVGSVALSLLAALTFLAALVVRQQRLGRPRGLHRGGRRRGRRQCDPVGGDRRCGGRLALRPAACRAGADAVGPAPPPGPEPAALLDVARHALRGPRRSGSWGRTPRVRPPRSGWPGSGIVRALHQMMGRETDG